MQELSLNCVIHMKHLEYRLVSQMADLFIRVKLRQPIGRQEAGLRYAECIPSSQVIVQEIKFLMKRLKNDILKLLKKVLINACAKHGLAN